MRLIFSIIIVLSFSFGLKSESYREAELKKVAQMTDRNQHLEARQFVAKKGGYTKHVKAYTALIALQDALGHTPRGTS